MIFKIHRKRRDFFQCSNAAVNDGRISFKAKGILCYLLSKPDTWTPRVGELASVGPDGKESVQSGLKELRAAGYAVLEVEQGGEDGRLTGQFWKIYEEPIEITLDGKTVERETPPTGNPATSNTERKVTQTGEQHVAASGNAQVTDCNAPPVTKRSVADELVESWNSIQGVVGCREMTPKRKKSLAARLTSDQWAANWPKALVKLDQSDFCKGGGGQNWRADIDWFLTPDAVTKLLEGKYDNKTEAPRQSDLPVYVAPNRVLRNGA